MTDRKPFFSERLLVTAPDGTYGGLRKRRRFRAFDDHLEIGEANVPYRDLAELTAYGNVLHIAYTGPDGKRTEEFFRHDTFLEGTGVKALAEMIARVDAVVRNHTRSQPPESDARSAAIDTVRAERLDPADNGWQRVAVYSASIAFPAACPVCVRPAEAIARLDASAGLNEKGAWLVPVCSQHIQEYTAHFGVANWRADRARLEFNVWNREYAELFVLANQGQANEKLRRMVESAPLLWEIKNGARFVQFQYAVSVILISFLLPSKIEKLERRESPVLRGVKYSLLSFVVGWWGIPVGPIFTVASIVRNSRGGIDLTETIATVLAGQPMSAGGYS